jgi:hypothetical protein
MKPARQFLVAMLVIVGGSAGGSAQAEEDASVTPYRPTVSNPAALSAPGWLEMEAGIARQSPGDGSRRTSLPYQMKYAFSPDFGILLGGDARVMQTDAEGNGLRGAGDTQLLLKHRWGLGEGEDAPALGLEWGVKSPTARSGLGSGKTDYIVNGIYSAELGGNTWDLNLNATRLGAWDEGSGRTQTGWATTLSRPLDARWSIAGELSGTARRGVARETQALFAVGYALSKRVVLDAGFAVGASRAAADRSIFFGVSFLVEKLH